MAKRKATRKINGETYHYTGKYSFTKAKARERAEGGRKKGLKVRIIPMKTVGKKKTTGYVLFAKKKKRRKRK